MKVFMKPIDSFYFRDHSDFTSGEDNVALTIFPPRPGTVYGALRSAYIHQYQSLSDFVKGIVNDDVKFWMGTSSEVGHLRMKGLFLAENREPIFPLPLDQLVLKEDEKLSAIPLQLKESISQSSDGNVFQLTSSVDGKTESSENKYISATAFKSILLADKKEAVINVNTPASYITTEDKLGIARDWKTKNSLDKMLYNIKKIHFSNKNMSFMALMDEPSASFQDIHYARLGGGNRPWVISEDSSPFSLLNDEEKLQLVKSIKKSGIAKLILLTPAIWQRGSRPSAFNPETNMLKLTEGLEVKVLSSALGRPLVIGGWDVVRNRPKERMNAVPAGSVLYVEVPEEKAEAFVNETYLKNSSDKLTHEGYGLIVPAAYQL